MRPYNQKDIQRYLQKQMTNEEMHAFEKAMIDDPFLADAFEGYEKADENMVAVHLSEIEAAINQKDQKAKVVGMPVRTNLWLRIAALFIIIVGAGIITYRILNKQEQPQIAVNKSIAPPVVNDTVKPVQATPETENASQPKDQLAQHKKASGSPIIKSVEPSQPVVETEESTAMALRDERSIDRALASERVALSERKMATGAAMAAKQAAPNVITGKVVDSKGEPIAGSTIIANNTVTSSAKDGSFVLPTTDTTVQAQVTSIGHEPAVAMLKEKAENTVVMKDDKKALSEVVVVGYGKKRNATNLSPTMEPVGGWERFNSYIDSARARIKETDRNYKTGDVEVSFSLDDKGKATNVQATSVNKKMRSVAIEIIKNGPAWKSNAPTQKHRVTIHF